jgi:hypothetical protein
MAHGELRDSLGLPALPPPHDRLDSSMLSPSGDSTVDLVALLNGNSTDATAKQQQPPAGEMPTGAAEVTPAFSAEQYQYDLKVTGTYAALIDLVNQLVLHPKLVKINKIVIIKSPDSKPEDEPDAKDFPDYPVKLEMTVSLALFLYATDATPPS